MKVKKICFAVLAALMLLVVFTVSALAMEAVEVAADVAQGVGALEEIEQEGLPVEPFNWAALGTIAGCTAFALLFVQLIKAPLDKVWHIPTRLVVYVVCLAVMLLSTAFTDGLTLQSGLLAAANAIIPALSAMGAYEITFGRKNEPPDK
jgi:hypothetical protein